MGFWKAGALFGLDTEGIIIGGLILLRELRTSVSVRVKGD